MNKPLASILILSYDQAEFIRDSLSSAVEQDYSNLEIVVADDGSTDGTTEIILEYARKSPDRVIPVVGYPHVGITGNFNRGLKMCKGKYIAFQGGDDVLLPGKIRKQVDWMERDSRRALGYHDVEVFDSATGKVLYCFSERHPMLAGKANIVIEEGTFCCGTSCMVRADAMPPNGFDARVSVAIDWLFWVDCLSKSDSTFGFIRGVHARYRRHSRNVTSSGAHQEDLKATLRILKAKYPQYSQAIRRRWADLHFIDAVRHLRAGHLVPALRTLLASLGVSQGVWAAPRLAWRELRWRIVYSNPTP